MRKQWRRKVASVGAALALFGTSVLIIGGTASATGGQVCEGLDSGKIDTTGDPSSVELTAPDGKLIDGYCVKAGSSSQGDGPEYFDVDPPVKSLTIEHSSGKAVSHYSVSYTDVPDEPKEIPVPQVPVSDPCGPDNAVYGEVPSGDYTVIRNSDGSITLVANAGYVFPGDKSEVTLPAPKDSGEECPPPTDECPPLTGSIKTTLPDGSVVNGNIYTSKSDVYVYGDQLGDVTTVYIRVTDPSGATVLSEVKQVSVVDGSFGPVQLPAFSDTPNNGDEYKVAVSTTEDFESKCTKFDNFKVRGEEPPPVDNPLNPSVTATASACVNKGESTGVVDFSVTNTDEGIVKPVTYTVNASNGATTTVTAGNGETVTGTLSGFAPGDYTITAEGDDDTMASTMVTVKECTATSTPNPTPTVTPTPTPTTPTPTTPTETPTPTTPTENPTPTTPTETPTPTSTPTVIPPHTGAGGDWTGGVTTASVDSSLMGLMGRIAIIGGLLLLGLAVWPSRRKVQI